MDWERRVAWLSQELSDYFQISRESGRRIIEKHLASAELVGDTLADADLMKSVEDGDDIRAAWILTNGVIARQQ